MWAHAELATTNNFHFFIYLHTDVSHATYNVYLIWSLNNNNISPPKTPKVIYELYNNITPISQDSNVGPYGARHTQ